jgi:hypothetical protein
MITILEGYPCCVKPQLVVLALLSILDGYYVKVEGPYLEVQMKPGPKIKDPNSLKRCPHCGEWKVRKDGFYYHKHPPQWGGWCKKCSTSTWRQARDEKLAAKRAARAAERAARPDDPKNQLPKWKLAPEGTKHCPKCDEYKPLDRFYIYDGKPVGTCKDCRRVISNTNRRAARARRRAEKMANESRISYVE